MILGWADAHRRQTGDWPTKDTGAVLNNPEETWLAVDAALRYGGRGLRGGSSLARLLAKYRGRWNCHGQPRLSQKKILAWADANFSRTGHWPNVNSGPVEEAPGESWDLIDNALRQGDRMLRGGSSLLQLLVKKRGVRNIANLLPFTKEHVLSWAQKHWERTGSWPTTNVVRFWKLRARLGQPWTVPRVMAQEVSPAGRHWPSYSMSIARG
jgi:hypothetical protein